MPNDSKIPREVVDERGNIHQIAEMLGQGGQGAVFRTADPRLAAKFLTDADGVPVAFAPGHEQLVRSLESVRLLPLPELHLAKPVALLRQPVPGYIMALMSDMVPIKELVYGPKSGSSLAEFYRDTGGLRRRLQVLANTAAILARLHAIPVVYADVSHNNVFISAGTDESETWLIDADNLQFLTSTTPGFYTPGFGAPEVVAGKSGVNTLTDSYAFAILAFWVLSQQHPFLGACVEECGWSQDADGDGDAEDKAFAGHFPWIHDEDDDSNYTAKGIPRELVLSGKMRALFQRAFGPGRLNSRARPGLREWTGVLQQAADLTLRCPACRHTFYITMPECPFCEGHVPAPRHVRIEAYRWLPDSAVAAARPTASQAEEAQAGAGLGRRPVWWKAVEIQSVGETTPLRRRLFTPTLFRDDDPVVVEMEFLRSGIRLSPVAESLGLLDLNIALRQEDSFVPLVEPKTLPLRDGSVSWQLHCASADRPHRVLFFRVCGEVRM